MGKNVFFMFHNRYKANSEDKKREICFVFRTSWSNFAFVTLR